MYYRHSHIIFLLALSFCAIVLRGQEALSFKEIDSVSYHLYVEKNWKVLAKFCQQHITTQNDYYYLRMRAGIANYELGRYRVATKHFQKAKAFNSGDEITNTYLKYAYLFSNRVEEAQQLEQGRKNKPVLKNYNAVAIDGGTKISNISNMGPALLGGISLWHSFGKNNSFLHSINTYLQQEERYNVDQWQYYLRYSRAFKQNVKVMAGFHYVFSAVAEKTYLTLEPKGFTHAPPPLVQTLTAIPVDAPSYTVVILPVKQNHELIASLNLVKQSEKLDVNIGGTVSKLDTTTLQQIHTGLVLYPLGNNKLQIGLQTHGYNYTQTNRFYTAFAPSISFAMGKSIYVQLAYYANKHVNIIEQTGQLVNNSIDYTGQRFSVSPSVLLSKGISVYGTYFFEQKQRLGDGLRYHYHLIYLGTKFNF